MLKTWGSHLMTLGNVKPFPDASGNPLTIREVVLDCLLLAPCQHPAIKLKRWNLAKLAFKAKIEDAILLSEDDKKIILDSASDHLGTHAFGSLFDLLEVIK